MEGARKTTKDQTWTFRTYSPLSIVRHRCAWSSGECRPHWPWNIEFNNPLDAEAFDEKLIRIEPEIDNLHTNVSWNHLTVSGRSKARTHYTIIVSPMARPMPEPAPVTMPALPSSNPIDTAFSW